jgi:peptidoglycan LD-endopeptidase LytH
MADETGMRRTLALVAVAAFGLTACFGGARGTFAIRCPITAPVHFDDTWHAPRPGGRLHEGTDLYAARWTPNQAVVGGRVDKYLSANAGRGINLYGDDGVVYFYAHLEAWNERLFDTGPGDADPHSAPVAPGDVVGYTGNSGNAISVGTHTHFSIHPGDGPAVPSYASLEIACAANRV